MHRLLFSFTIYSSPYTIAFIQTYIAASKFHFLRSPSASCSRLLLLPAHYSSAASSSSHFCAPSERTPQQRMTGSRSLRVTEQSSRKLRRPVHSLHLSLPPQTYLYSRPAQMCRSHTSVHGNILHYVCNLMFWWKPWHHSLHVAYLHVICMSKII